MNEAIQGQEDKFAGDLTVMGGLGPRNIRNEQGESKNRPEFKPFITFRTRPDTQCSDEESYPA